METFILRWLCDGRPKSYCAFTAGGRTMLNNSYERASDRVVTIINDDHRRYLDEPRLVGAGAAQFHPAVKARP